MGLDLSDDFNLIVEEQIKRFATWAAKNWKLTPSDELEMRRQGSSAEYLRGYNVALDSLPLALECWLEDGAGGYGG